MSVDSTAEFGCDITDLYQDVVDQRPIQLDPVPLNTQESDNDITRPKGGNEGNSKRDDLHLEDRRGWDTFEWRG